MAKYHISLAQNADLSVVAPATANIIGIKYYSCNLTGLKEIIK